MAQIISRLDSRKKKKYTARIRLQGRQVTQTFSVRKDAEAWVRQTEAAIERGDYGTGKNARGRTVTSLIEDFEKERLPDYADHVKMKTLLAFWKKEIGKISVQRLTPSDIAEVRTRLRLQISKRTGKPITGKTINRYTAALSAVMKWGSQEKMLRKDNPVRMIGRMKEVTKEPQFIPTREDINALRAAAKADADPMALPLILTTLATGMRLGELVRLRWSEVKLKEGLLHIPVTKNGEPRTVRLAGAALAALTEWGRVRRLASDLVFPPLDPEAENDDGTEVDGRDRVARIWKRLRKTTPGTDVKFHALRHTAGTWLSQEGFHPTDVARILGHSSLAMALVYQHMTESRRDEIATKLADAMFGEEGA
jgi:integrase